jgi:hypothetical protein
MRGHAWDTLVGNMLLAYVCSARGDGNGKIDCNTASGDDSGFCPDVGGRAMNNSK